MSAVDRLACKIGMSSEIPNQELARELATTADAAAVAEIAAGLHSGDKSVQSDCIKVLYELGFLRPELISGYAGDFLRLLSGRNNRLIWGAMIALATVAHLNAGVILNKIGVVYDAMNAGSVITVDNGVKTLAAVASACQEKSAPICEYLFEHLKVCRAKEVPQHAESTLPAIHSGNREAFASILKEREPDMTPSQMARIRKLYRALNKIK